MNFIKNFGGSGAPVSKPLGAKNSYFSSLKLQDEQPVSKGKLKDVGGKGDKRKGPPKDFIPHKFALVFGPPCIILEYKDPNNDKLYHHKMSLKKLKKDTPTKDALDFLKKKHSQYFNAKVIDESQIESILLISIELIQKLKKDMLDDSKIKMQDVQEEDDFDYDLDGDFDDL